MKAVKLVLLIVVLAVACSYIAGCEHHKDKKSIAAAKKEADTSYVNITNPNGSVTPVRIIRKGNVYVGPKGEQYTSYPTVEQLQPVYGIK